MKILALLLIAAYAHPTRAVVNDNKPVSSDTKEEVEEPQAAPSSYTGYQYQFPVENHLATTPTPFPQYAPQGATIPPNYYYPSPTVAPSAAIPSHYNHHPSQSPFPNTPYSYPPNGYNYGAPAGTQPASYSMHGWPVYQQQEQTPALAVSVEGDIKEQQKLLHNAASYYVPPTQGPNNKLSYEAPSFFVPRTRQVTSQHREKQKGDKKAEQKTKLSMVEHPKEISLTSILSEIPKIQKFLPQEGLDTKSNEISKSHKKIASTQAPNHKYPDSEESSKQKSQLIYERHEEQPANTTGQSVGARIVQNRYTSVIEKQVPAPSGYAGYSTESQATQDYDHTSPQTLLNTFDQYLNYRLRQLQKQPIPAKSTFTQNTYPIEAPQSPEPTPAPALAPASQQSSHFANVAFGLPNIFPASNLELPKATPTTDYAAQYARIPVSMYGSNAAPNSAQLPSHYHNFGVPIDHYNTLNTPTGFTDSQRFAVPPQFPNPSSSNVDFVQRQSQSYELPTHTTYIMDSIEPSRELMFNPNSGQQPQLSAPVQPQQQQIQQGYEVERQPHNVYGVPQYPNYAQYGAHSSANEGYQQSSLTRQHF